MDDYLSFANKWVKTVSSEEAAIFIVIEQIEELYENKGERLQTVPELRKILAKHVNNPTVRKLVHFKLAEIYKDTGQASKALQELHAIASIDNR